MAAIVACYAVCNEVRLVGESIRSVKAYVDRFVVVDSVFTANPLPATHSTDSTRLEFTCLCHPVELVYLESDRKLSQPDARNRYLEAVPKGDWILVMDGDEVLYGDRRALEGLFAQLRAGVSWGVASLPVYTTAIAADGRHAPAIDAETYQTAPVVTTRGWQPRLFRNGPWRYRHNEVTRIPHGLYDSAGASIGTPNRRAEGLIVNRHVSQTYEEYQADYVQETAQRAPALDIGPMT